MKKYSTGMFLILLVTGFCFGCTFDADRQRPNIVLIIGDDISFNDFGYAGNGDLNTPNIDRLAAEGVRFSNAYLTASSCSPSRCSIITGRYPHNNGRAAELHGPLPSHLPLFPKLLMEAGYYTAHAGKWHIGSNEAYFTSDEPANAAFHVAGGKTGTREDALNGGEGNWIQRLRERPKDRPFFMWFASHDAHRSFTADTIPEAVSWHEEVFVPPFLAQSGNTREDLVSYYNEIIRLDRYTGKVVEELERQGVLDNTVIIFMADNGRPFMRSKTRVYDSGMKTPFIVYAPGMYKEGDRVNSNLISAIDIAPTILDLAGIEAPGTMQGLSIREMIEDADAAIREYTFSEHNWHDFTAYSRQMRWKQYMYITNRRPGLQQPGPADAINSPSGKELFDLHEQGKLTPAQRDPFIAPRPEEELYDVEADPFQLNNLAGEEEHREVLNEMRAVMERWREETGDSDPGVGELTPDWFTLDPPGTSEQFGVRGTTPGTAAKAERINNRGPY